MGIIFLEERNPTDHRLCSSSSCAGHRISSIFFGPTSENRKFQNKKETKNRKALFVSLNNEPQLLGNTRNGILVDKALGAGFDS